MSNPENDARVPLTRRQLREQVAAQEAARAAEEAAARAAEEAAARAAALEAARSAEQTATRRARNAAPRAESLSHVAPTGASGSHAAPAGTSPSHVAPTGASGSHAAPRTSPSHAARGPSNAARPTADAAATPQRPQPSYLSTSALGAAAPPPAPAAAPAPAAQAPAPAPPLSRKQLRERAAALRAEQKSQAAESAQASQVAPAVQPPSVTGAVRALDETGQLTPVRPIASTGIHVPDVEPAEPTRVPVRDSIARVESDGPARTSAQGRVPQPAAPARQQNPFSSPTSRTGASAPSVSPVSPVAAGAPAATGPGAPSGPAWLPVNPAGTGTPVGQGPAVASPPARSAGWAPTGAADDTVAVPPVDEEFEPPVPQWGAVLPVDPPRRTPAGSPLAGGPDEAHDEDDEPSGWFGYTPLQYLLWVVIGLVLGVVIWQLIDRADDSPQGTGALTSVSSEYYQAAAPGP